ncbi:MAG: peptidoglycan-binding domain-containing protein [Rhodospirillales bacterium]
MFWPLRLKNPIGKPYNMGPEDTLAAKKVLASLGHMEVPDYGIDEYPDQPMIDAVKKFQRTSGLREDGIMKPGGETEAGLNAAMRTLNEESGTALGRGNGSNEIRGSGQPIKMANAYRRRFPGDRWGPEGAMKSGGFYSDGGGWGAATVSTAAAAKVLLDQRAEKVGGGEVPHPPQSRKHSRRSLLESPPPPNPGFEPPDQKLPGRMKELPEYVEVKAPSEIPANLSEPKIFILPAPKPDEFGNGIVFNKGNEDTRKQHEEIRDYFEQEIGWNHIAGGRFGSRHELVRKGIRAVGDEQKEYYLPGPIGTLKGGNFTDLTFEDEKTGKIYHIQTVDVDRNGRPTEAELNAAERIRRKVGRNGHVYLVPKTWQLERNQKLRKRK